MIIVGDNLKGLIQQHTIVENEPQCFDDTSISLRLDNTIINIEPSSDDVFNYGSEIPENWIKERYIKNDETLILEPKSATLCCSYEVVKIPIGYFGFLQTKGSLARLFVTVHCCDSQIEPGFSGKVTFEIVNLSNMRIGIKPKQKIADLFIFKASTRQVKAYNGRYNNANKPTIQKPDII
jgi:dCTP deaminase